MCATAFLSHTLCLSCLFGVSTCHVFTLAFLYCTLAAWRPPARMFPAKGMSAPLRSDPSYPCLIKPHMFSSLSLLVYSEGEGKKRTRCSAARSISGSSNSHCSLLPICFYFQELRGTIELAVLSGVCSHRENQNKRVCADWSETHKSQTRQNRRPTGFDHGPGVEW